MTPFRMATRKGKGKMSNSLKSNLQGAAVFVALCAGFGTVAAFGASPSDHVPGVVGDSKARAEHILAGEGYKWKTTPADPKGAHWYVSSQKPGSGTLEPAGTVVKLKLIRHSTGTAEVTVPDVRGDKYAQAVKILAQSGLTAKRDGAGNFTVATENPAAYTTVDRGSTVTLSPGN